MKELLSIIIQILWLSLLAQIIISWLGVAGVKNDFIFRLNNALYVITDPFMKPLRRIIPTIGMLDLTPIVAFAILWLAQKVVDAKL